MNMHSSTTLSAKLPVGKRSEVDKIDFEAAQGGI